MTFFIPKFHSENLKAICISHTITLCKTTNTAKITDTGAHAMLLHDLKVVIWCAIGTWRMTGPLSFHETVNSKPYTRVTL
jgi:hypothetical protein